MPAGSSQRRKLPVVIGRHAVIAPVAVSHGSLVVEIARGPSSASHPRLAG